MPRETEEMQNSLTPKIDKLLRNNGDFINEFEITDEWRSTPKKGLFLISTR